MSKHRRRYENPNDARSLTFSCFGRKPFLSKDRSRQWFIDALQGARERHGFHLWAYVIMPEHAHLLIWPNHSASSISQILSTIKQSVAKRALLYIRERSPAFLRQMEDRQPNGKICYRFWQRGGGYDRNLTEPSTVWKEVDYLHTNPLRRGLCECATDWTWSSAAEHARPGSGPISINRESLPRLYE